MNQNTANPACAPNPLPPTAGFELVDWAAPWLAPLAARHGADLQNNLAQGLAVYQALNAQANASDAGVDLPVRFVPQQDLPAGQAYEAFIFATGQVPTRHNLHDLFNGLTWLNLPQAKARMNALQAGQIAAHGIGAQRGPVRDALTLMDENGAILLAPAPLWQALLARQWSKLFADLRPLWQQARLLLVGHALQEQLVRPRKPITAHVYTPSAQWQLPPDASLTEVDAMLAASLQATLLQTKPFTPLPVLGVPGWWPANADPAFYADTTVFRPMRVSGVAASKPGQPV